MSTATSAIGKRVFVPVPHTGWAVDAKCRDEDPELFFSTIGTEAGRLRASQKAATVCRSCPVRSKCAGQALAVGERFGVWAGENLETNTARERRFKLDRLRAIAEGVA